ncbi:S8 family peptidase [Paenibacillus sp. OK003]|uniref:S8 family peptidase n=1 Tax=Paenibacillus sp. OK003 TaxID=1884380 RepID=UPI0008CC69CF|nr:S8 family peptidase [Paenibacillus sp. OK003]SEL79010.1 subtilisin [Paenibacillus sp. OK003]
MKIIGLLSSFCLITVMLISSGALAASESNDPSISETYDGTYLVKLNSVTTTASNGVIEKLGGRLKKISESGDIVVAELSGSSLYELKNSPDIQYIEPDYEVKTEIEAEKTESVTETIPYGIQNIHAIEAQQDGYTGKGVKIAVLDSGYSQHSDLKVKSGYSFITNSNNYADDFGHGTHVAGIIAASINGEGVVGVAPMAEIYAIKVLDQGGRGSYFTLIEGIDWSIKHKMDIINISFGGENPSQILEEKIQEAYDAGILIIAAAGNDGYMGDDTILYPARYSTAIAVGAIDSNNERAFFSAKGPALDLVAPGVKVLSTLPNNQYGMKSGTSMAAPHVTGVAALILDKNKKLSPNEVVDILESTAKPLGVISEYGHGIVQAKEAVDQTACQ